MPANKPPLAKKTVKNGQSDEREILITISHLTQRDPVRFIKGFEQYVGATISPRRLLIWLKMLASRNTPLTYKNIAELRDDQTRTALTNSPKRRPVNNSAIARPPQTIPIAATQSYRGGCLCEVEDRQILKWIQSQTIPEEALDKDCCWVRICQVRGRHFIEVEEDTWEEICRTRGYLKYAGGLLHQ